MSQPIGEDMATVEDLETPIFDEITEYPEDHS